MVSKYFYVNVSASNEELIAVMRSLDIHRFKLALSYRKKYDCRRENNDQNSPIYCTFTTMEGDLDRAKLLFSGRSGGASAVKIQTYT